MKWEILEVHTKDDLIYHVKYRASEGDVASEGYWYFDQPKPLTGVDENTVIQWVRSETMKDGQNAVELRIKEQASSKTQEVHPPWKPKTFTVTI